MNKKVAKVIDSNGTRTVYIPCECHMNEHTIVWTAYRPEEYHNHVDIDNYFSIAYPSASLWTRIKLTAKYLFTNTMFESREGCTSLSITSLRELRNEIDEYLKEVDELQSKIAK